MADNSRDVYSRSSKGQAKIALGRMSSGLVFPWVVFPTNSLYFFLSQIVLDRVFVCSEIYSPLLFGNVMGDTILNSSYTSLG